MESGRMYTIIIYKYGKENTVETYATSIDEAIQKVQRAKLKVNKAKTLDLNKKENTN